MALLRSLWRERWLILGLSLGLIVASLHPPEGMGPEGMKALGLLALAVVLFITEPIPLPAVALLIAFLQVLLGLGSPTEVARSFMSDAILFILGSLMISVAIVKQRFDRRIALFLFRLTGPRTGRFVFGLVAVAAILSSLIGAYTMAALLLPMALAIISQAQKEGAEMRTANLERLLLLAIAYGCTIGTCGTPSGGPRNAIILEYWERLFGLEMSYPGWIAHLYPLVLLQIPLVGGLLLWTFRPEVRDLSPVLAHLRASLRGNAWGRRDWGVLGVFLLTLCGWLTLSGRLGLGAVALAGAALYLISGLVSWEELNSGVNWGVVLLYAAIISLGYQMKETGAAAWLADHLLRGLRPLGLAQGLPLLLGMGLLTVLFANSMSSGAAVAVLGPLTLNLAALSGGSLLSAGLLTAGASTFAYLTVIAAPATLIVYGGSEGQLSSRDLLRAGFRLLPASVIILIGVAALYWPRLGPGR